jgi:hypothetical protein
MKYFTPDLLARFGSTDDLVADAAYEEWEAKREAYDKHLKEIGKQLPRSVRRFIKEYRLHDARVVLIGNQPPRSFALFLELDASRNEGVLLVYSLAAPPQMIRHPVLSENTDGVQAEWLYDEIDIIGVDNISAFRHSILFTGGVELQLVFYRLKCVPFKRVPLSEANMLGGSEALLGCG